VHREPEIRRGRRSIIVMFVSLVLLTAIDLGTKEWALDNLSVPRLADDAAEVCQPDRHGHIAYQREPSAPRPLVDGLLNLYYAENCGAAFSMLRTAPAWLRLAVFGSASVFAATVLPLTFIRGGGGPLFAIAVPMIVAGAIGNNLWDRPRHGFVVDFLQVHPDLFNYPIFNVADIWITIGIALMLMDGFRKPRLRAAPPARVISASS
jgi:signal peptidase II